MNIDDRTLSNEGLIDAALYQGMWDLQRKVEEGHNVPISRFTELLIWAKNRKAEIFNDELEDFKKKGWKIESRKWCGIPYHEFEIPSLHLFKS